MKIKEIFLASNNRYKQIELQKVFKNQKIILPADKKINFFCEETGKTFLDNALLKAQTLFNICKLPVLADDSGLCVETLAGKPGVYSACFGSELPNPPANDQERNAYLLSLLPKDDFNPAFFVCALILIVDQYRFFAVQEIVRGTIIRQARGTNGFGYDPIFYLPELDKTLAELPLKLKNKYSHRGKAALRMAAFLKQDL